MGKQKKGGRKEYTEGPAEEEEEEVEVKGGKGGRGLGGQNSNAGMLPPNSSDEEEEEEEVPKGKKGAGQSATAGMMPPNSSDEEEESEDDDEPVQLTRKEREQLAAQKPAEPDPEQISKDMARLEMIKAKRAKDAERRIANDGWDRMKPMSADNHPPGMKWPPEGQ